MPSSVDMTPSVNHLLELNYQHSTLAKKGFNLGLKRKIKDLSLLSKQSKTGAYIRYNSYNRYTIQ